MKTGTSRYWLFWWGLIILMGVSAYLTAAGDWSQSMKMHTGLGFADDVTSPVIALELARDGSEFGDVLGILPPPRSAPGEPAEKKPRLPESSISDIQKDVGSVVTTLQRDYAFIPVYTIVFILLAWHLFTIQAVVSRVLMGLLILLPLVAATTDVMENRLALRILEKIKPLLETTGYEAVPEEKAQIAKVDGEKHLGIWQKLRSENVIVVSTTGESLDKLFQEAKLENVEPAVLNDLRKSASSKEGLEKLSAAGYSFVKQNLAVPVPPPGIVPEVTLTPFEQVMVKLRDACKFPPGYAMRHFSLAKWVVSFALFALLGWCMLKRRGTAGRSPGTDWCMAGLLMIVGGLTGLTGVFLWPICIESGFLFVLLAMVPLFIGGLRRALSAASGRLT